MIHANTAYTVTYQRNLKESQDELDNIERHILSAAERGYSSCTVAPLNGYNFFVKNYLVKEYGYVCDFSPKGYAISWAHPTIKH